MRAVTSGTNILSILGIEAREDAVSNLIAYALNVSKTAGPPDSKARAILRRYGRLSLLLRLAGVERLRLRR
jgi:hypothetical protein